jgi:serine/threonine-protein kinase RsbW
MDHHVAGGAADGADSGKGAPNGADAAATGAAGAVHGSARSSAPSGPAAMQAPVEAGSGPRTPDAPLGPSAAVAAAQHNGAPPPGRLRVNLEFDFPSDVDYIERVVGMVTRQCEDFAYSARQCALNVPVALTEALSNAILRGNGDDRRKHVRVRAQVDERELVLEVADEGKGFDFERCMGDPTTPENLAREDGRGLYLMRRLMDRVERFSENGNVVRLTLKRG